MSDILSQAKIKRAELKMVIGTLVDYYSDRATFITGRAKRMRLYALVSAVASIGMLGAFIFEDDESLALGMISLLLMGAVTFILYLYEKRRDRASECLDRVKELFEFADYLADDVLVLENARARKRWYTTRIGILKVEYLHSRRVMGGLELDFDFEPPPEYRADKMLKTIDDISLAVASGRVTRTVAASVANGLAEVGSGLAD